MLMHTPNLILFSERDGLVTELIFLHTKHAANMDKELWWKPVSCNETQHLLIFTAQALVREMSPWQ